MTWRQVGAVIFTMTIIAIFVVVIALELTAGQMMRDIHETRGHTSGRNAG